MTTADQCCLDLRIIHNETYENCNNSDNDDNDDDILSSPVQIRSTESIQSIPSSVSDSSFSSIKSAYRIGSSNCKNDNLLHGQNVLRSSIDDPNGLLTLMPEQLISETSNYYFDNINVIETKFTIEKPKNLVSELYLNKLNHEHPQQQQLYEGCTEENSKDQLLCTNERICHALTILNDENDIFDAIKHYISFCSIEFGKNLQSTLKCRTLARGISRTLDLLQASVYCHNKDEYLYSVCELVAIYTSCELIYAREFKDHKLQIADRILFVANRFLGNDDKEITRDNFLRMFTRIRKMYGEREIMTALFRHFIPEKLFENQKELPDKTFIQYILIFYQWKEMELTEEDQNNIIEYADNFMRPRQSLFINNCYTRFLPEYRPFEHSTRYILTNLRFFEELRDATILDSHLSSTLYKNQQLEIDSKYMLNEKTDIIVPRSEQMPILDLTIDDDDTTNGHDFQSLLNLSQSKEKNRFRMLFNTRSNTDIPIQRKKTDLDSCEINLMPYRNDGGHCKNQCSNDHIENTITQSEQYDISSLQNQYHQTALSKKHMHIDSNHLLQRKQQLIKHQQRQYHTGCKHKLENDVDNYDICTNIERPLMINIRNKNYLKDLEAALAFDMGQTISDEAILFSIPKLRRSSEQNKCLKFENEKCKNEILDKLKYEYNLKKFDEIVKDQKKQHKKPYLNQQLDNPFQKKSIAKRRYKNSLEMDYKELNMAKNSWQFNDQDSIKKLKTKHVKFNERPLGPTRSPPSSDTSTVLPSKSTINSLKVEQYNDYKRYKDSKNKKLYSFANIHNQNTSDNIRYADYIAFK